MKYWGQVRNILLSTLWAWGCGLIVCRLLGRAPAEALALALVGFMGSWLCALSLNRKQWIAGVLMGVGVVFAAGLGLLWLQSVSLTLCMMAAALLTFGSTTGCAFRGALGCWSVVLLTVATLLSGHFGPRWQTAACLGALLALGLTLDGFRETSLRRGQHLKPEMPLGRAFGLQKNSLILYGLFLAGAVAAALGLMGLWTLIANSVKALLHLLLTGTGAFGYTLARLLKRFMDWILYLLSLIPTPPGGGGGDTIDKPVYTGGPGSAASTILLVILTAAGAVALAAAVGAVILRQRIHRKADAPAVCDYVDEIETLERPKRRLARLFRRKARISDYQGAMKIRFAFQQLLFQRRKSDTLAYAKTPNELRQPDQPDQSTLIDAYNRVRYAGGSATEAEIAAAERFLRTIR